MYYGLREIKNLNKEYCDCENNFGNQLIHLAILVRKGV